MRRALSYPLYKTALEKAAQDFLFHTVEGSPFPLAQFEGRLLLIVNTATECYFTRQLDELQRLWCAYQMKGLTVIGVPCDDFGGQSPGTDAEIFRFHAQRYEVDFPVVAREVARGDDAHPFFLWMREALGAQSRPRWNFHKYLISPEGKPVAFFPSYVRPMSRRMIEAIEEHLPRTRPL